MKRLSCCLAVLMLAACTVQPKVVTAPENAHIEPEAPLLTDPQGCLDLTEQDLFDNDLNYLEMWLFRCRNEVNGKYAELLMRADRKDMRSYGFTRPMLEDAHMKQREYQYALCSDPINAELGLRSASDWFLARCLIRQDQSYLRTLNEF